MTAIALPSEPPNRRWWRRHPALSLLGGSVLSFWAAVGLGPLTPDVDEIVMLGPVSSDQAAIILFAIAFYSFGASVIVAVTGPAIRHDTFLTVAAMVLVWIIALPIGLIGSGLLAVIYSAQPQTHRFSLGSDRYLVTTKTGFLSASDENVIDLYRRHGSRYVRTGQDLSWSATTEFGPSGIRVTHDVDGDWLEYPGSDGGPQRYRIR